MTPTMTVCTRRPAEEADHSLLRRLFTESRDDLLLLPAEVRDTLTQMQWLAQRRQVETDHPNARHEILLLGEEPVGQLILDIGTDAIHLVDICVLAAYRRRGLASATLADVLAEADRRNLPVRLSVWSANTTARKLYERAGFSYAATPCSADAYLQMTRQPTHEVS